MFDLRDQNFRRAVMNIERRAERQLYDERLTQSYVPTRALEDLHTTQNQLLYGRRGVGKTHTLKYYLSEQASGGALCHYIDCTSFGSGLSSDGAPLNTAIRFFSTFVARVAGELFEAALAMEAPAGSGQDGVTAAAAALERSAQPRDGRFDYVAINAAINRALTALGSERLLVVLDEWAQIPIAAQPYFAEFVKRSFFANPRLTLKISVVDYSYRLTETSPSGQMIGLEHSADVFSDIRMDRYFVWDEDRQSVEQFFAEVLYNHLALNLDLSTDVPPTRKREVVQGYFTQAEVFADLCRASEGNTRDFLVMFAKAHEEFLRQSGHQRVGRADVNNAAALWYRQDKHVNIASEGHLERFLEYLLNDIIQQRKSRTVMIPVSEMRHPLLQRLFSARILHPLTVIWSHPDRPGERYNLVTIDYGTYVTLRGTKSAPFEEAFWFSGDRIPDEVADDLVPLDDRRSIRRIVVTHEVLSRFWEASPAPV